MRRSVSNICELELPFFMFETSFDFCSVEARIENKVNVASFSFNYMNYATSFIIFYCSIVSYHITPFYKSITAQKLGLAHWGRVTRIYEQ